MADNSTVPGMLMLAALPAISVESHMGDCTSSAAAHDRLALVSDRMQTIVCACCGETMKHFRTIAELGVRPEKYIFVCPFCKGVDYREPRKAA